LLISPDPRTGLTAEQLNTIAEFVGLGPVTAASVPRRSLRARLRRV
jgi:hypothetical protein